VANSCEHGNEPSVYVFMT